MENAKIITMEELMELENQYKVKYLISKNGFRWYFYIDENKENHDIKVAYSIDNI